MGGAQIVTQIVAVPPFALYDGEIASQATATAGVINTAYLVGVKLETPGILNFVQIRCVVGGVNHYDLGIYDATGDANGGPGNLLAHAAATATSLLTVTATLLKPAFLNGPIYLPAARYWLAFWVDGATDTFNKVASAAGNTCVNKTGTNAGPLPALASSLAGLTDGGLKFSLMGFMQNGFT